MNQSRLLSRDDAYLRIRDLLIAGEFAPDAALSERSLAESLGLGRTPVREALKALARDGLLVVHPMRGTFVRQLSFDDLREIHEMRLALEGLAAFLAASRGPSAGLEAVAEDLRRLAAQEKIDVEEAQQVGWSFHDELFRASGNGRLAATYDGLRAQSGLALQKMRQYSLDRTRRAIAEHLDIYAAVAARDPDAAQQRMWRHLGSAFEARLSALGAVRPRTKS